MPSLTKRRLFELIYAKCLLQNISISGLNRPSAVSLFLSLSPAVITPFILMLRLSKSDTTLEHSRVETCQHKSQIYKRARAHNGLIVLFSSRKGMISLPDRNPLLSFSSAARLIYHVCRVFQFSALLIKQSSSGKGASGFCQLLSEQSTFLIMLHRSGQKMSKI